MTLLSDLPAPDHDQVTGHGQWRSAFAVSDLATASLVAVGQELAGLITAMNLAPDRPKVTVDQRLASLWYGYSFRPQGWEMPGLWDAIAGDYQTADGWIRLHTNLPHHRAAALSVLGCKSDREVVADAVRQWQADDLETAVVGAGGVAAAMRSRAAWLAHPQGRAISSEPLIHWDTPRPSQLRTRPQACAEHPLAGLRVLDLTRVIAGPVSTRTLAGFGADVLRIDPPGWDEPGVITDVSLGKHMATLDLRAPDGRQQFEALLSQADVLVHGYRPGALEGLGYGAEVRHQIAPNLIEVALNAYGWSGPWAERRGFDSLVQMSAGIADTGRHWVGAEKPTPLPVQALDHATGYLMAAAVLSALKLAANGQPIGTARLSLARTAEQLAELAPQPADAVAEITTAEDADFSPAPEQSSWGPGLRLLPPLTVGSARMLWDHPATSCGTAPVRWPVSGR